MTKKQLRECHSVAKELRDLRDRIAALDSRMQSPKRSQPRKVQGSQSDPTDPYSDLVGLKDKLRGTYQDKERELWRHQLEIEEAIDDAALTSLERRLMRYRYFDGLTWEEVAEAIGYEERQTRRIHSYIMRRMSLNVRLTV